MRTWITQFWQINSRLSYFLLPITWLYRCVIAARLYFYHREILKVYKPHVPVIIVGNITVGGTGKTPVVIALANFLTQQGFKPGIVSRGYGGKSSTYPLLVTKTSDVIAAGDEPVLIARNTDCPVMIDPNRVRGVKKLVEAFACNLIIADDGLQHYALGRDIEIAVIDGQRRFGNGHCLPAGPLREPISRLAKVDLIVCNGQARLNEYPMSLSIKPLKNVSKPSEEKSLLEFKGRAVHAIAGIGNPDRFFSLLLDYGIIVVEHPFPDHHVFTAEELQFNDNLPILMTEKDAVKCTQIAPARAWYLPVTAEFSADFWQAVKERLH